MKFPKMPKGTLPYVKCPLPAPPFFVMMNIQRNIDKNESIQSTGTGGTDMKKLFCYADMYLQKSDWKDMAMLKFCLFSMGLLVGMRIPEEHKKKAGIAAMLVFLLTYIPLMTKFIGIVAENEA